MKDEHLIGWIPGSVRNYRVVVSSRTFTLDKLEAWVAAIRAAALEEAAKVCEGDNAREHWRCSPEDCAADIRALK